MRIAKNTENSTNTNQQVSLKMGMGYKLNKAASIQHSDPNFISKWFKNQRHQSFQYAKSLIK